jgi:hypothetical protein
MTNMWRTSPDSLSVRRLNQSAPVTVRQVIRQGFPLKVSAVWMKEMLRFDQGFLSRPVRYKKGEPSLERSISHACADWQN